MLCVRDLRDARVRIARAFERTLLSNAREKDCDDVGSLSMIGHVIAIGCARKT